MKGGGHLNPYLDPGFKKKKKDCLIFQNSVSSLLFLLYFAVSLDILPMCLSLATISMENPKSQSLALISILNPDINF